MRGLAVVTGTTRGIGTEVARQLAGDGWQLVLVNRDLTRAQALAEELRDSVAASVCADLADHRSIDNATREITARFERVDLLLNNAGVQLGPRRNSAQGIEMHFEVNTLAPYQLVRGLAGPLLAAHGTVLTVGSRGMLHTRGLKVDALLNPTNNRPLFGPYTQSKFAVAAVMGGLAREYADRGIVFRVCCPGPTKTRGTTGEGMPWFLRPVSAIAFKPATRSAAKLVDALDPRFGRETGLYIHDGKVRPMPPQAVDPAVQRRLLEMCRDLTGV
ncbi:MAG: SDR family NAD(P)-dependent oxidoreductase [Candidatus Dormibacteraeota bacterium]|uniref:SDR family NAD(P)-dependent oxidoreductase n=1 Tax=Candidatus Aeolococcus gillhamiae TaxID=3127015 RepID=A0A934JVV5_9BACT|nr:SDR family NAD(P)-dependent oxidoreductase [Candidatus Dormibacteraeota bacterium]